jgi:lipopolysaccharide exporter
MSLKGQTVSGVKWAFASSVVTTGALTLQLAVLARLLSPEDFGLMAMVMVVIGFAQAYADAGISAAIIHRQDTTSEQLSSLYWLNIFAGISVFFIVWLMTPVVILLYREPRLASLLQVVSLTFLIMPLGKQFEILLQKELRFDLLAKQRMSAAIAGAVVAIASAALGQGVWSLVWGQLGLAAMNTAMLMMVGWRQYRPTFHFNHKDLRGYLSFGLYQMGERSINFLAQRMDQLLIGGLLGAQSLGYYNFAFSLAIQPMSRINPIVTRVVFPVFAKVQNDANRLQRGYLKVLSLLTTVNAPMLIGMVVLAPWAIPLIFGEQWFGSIILVQILALVALLRSTGNPMGSLLLARGRADLGFKWNLMLFVIVIPTVYVGGKLGNAAGVTLSLLALQLALQIPAYICLIQPLIGACVVSYVQAIAKPVAMATVMGGGVWLINLVSHGGWRGLLTQVSAGVGLYLLLFWIVDKAQLVELMDLILGAHNPITKKWFRAVRLRLLP